MSRVNIKEITRVLNIARLEADNRVFKNRKEFQEYLKSYGLKVGSCNLINKLYEAMCDDRGKLLPNPIHIEKVTSIYEAVKEYQKGYYRKTKEMKPESKDLILAAIELLKSKGYRILKPVTEYKEV